MQNTFKLLVAFDGSPFSDAAIEDLATAGLPSTGVDARVVSIAEAWELHDLVGLGPSGSGRIGAERAELLLSRLNQDRKSTRLNSSHVKKSYAASCWKK